MSLTIVHIFGIVVVDVTLTQGSQMEDSLSLKHEMGPGSPARTHSTTLTLVCLDILAFSAFALPCYETFGVLH